MENALDCQDILSQFPKAIEIGQGGQKKVFKIEHGQYGVCVLKIGSFVSRQRLERIRREYETLRSIESSYFPKCYEMEVLDGHRFYILEQLLPGTTLLECIAEFQDITRSLKLIKSIVDALSLLWTRDVIHRDIKPANIMIGDEDRVCVIDLGIARLLGEESLTYSFDGRGPCTPAYASPEQLRNQKHAINHRCDQFAIGIVWAQLILGGRHPFDPQIVGAGNDVVENILQGRWASSALQTDQSRAILPVLSKLLQTEPHRRYRSPDLLVDALVSIE